MSVESLALALHHSRAKGSAKLVLIGIANHDGDGGSYPATITLAKYAGFEGWNAEPEDDSEAAKKAARKRRENAKKAAREAVRKLEALGEVEVTTNGGVQGKPEHERTNLYRILITCPPECDRSAQHRLIPAEPVDNSAVDPRGNSPAPGQQPRPPRGHSPAEPSFNQTIGNYVSEPEESRASDRYSESPKRQDEYASWSPGEKVAAARRRMVEAKSKPAPRSRSTVPPAPPVPRFDPASVPDAPPPRSPEQDAAVAALHAQPADHEHLIPLTSTVCLRCGVDAVTAIEAGRPRSAPQRDDAGQTGPPRE